MQKTILLVTLIIATSFSIFGQTTGKQSSKISKTEQVIKGLYDEFSNALVKRDTVVMERLLADDYIGVSPTGLRSYKSELVAAFKIPVPSGAGKLEALEVSDSKVRVYGKTAVLTARVTLHRQTANGQDYNDFYTATMVAVTINGRWQIVSTHESQLPLARQVTNTSN